MRRSADRTPARMGEINKERNANIFPVEVKVILGFKISVRIRMMVMRMTATRIVPGSITITYLGFELRFFVIVSSLMLPANQLVSSNLLSCRSRVSDAVCCSAFLPSSRILQSSPRSVQLRYWKGPVFTGRVILRDGHRIDRMANTALLIQ